VPAAGLPSWITPEKVVFRLFVPSVSFLPFKVTRPLPPRDPRPIPASLTPTQELGGFYPLPSKIMRAGAAIAEIGKNETPTERTGHAGRAGDDHQSRADRGGRSQTPFHVNVVANPTTADRATINNEDQVGALEEVAAFIEDRRHAGFRVVVKIRDAALRTARGGHASFCDLRIIAPFRAVSVYRRS